MGSQRHRRALPHCVARLVPNVCIFNTAIGGAALVNNTTGTGNTATGSLALNANTTGVSVNAAATGIAIQAAGGGAAHQNMPPTRICNFIMRIL